MGKTKLANKKTECQKTIVDLIEAIDDTMGECAKLNPRVEKINSIFKKIDNFLNIPLKTEKDLSDLSRQISQARDVVFIATKFKPLSFLEGAQPPLTTCNNVVISGKNELAKLNKSLRGFRNLISVAYGAFKIMGKGTQAVIDNGDQWKEGLVVLDATIYIMRFTEEYLPNEDVKKALEKILNAFDGNIDKAIDAVELINTILGKINDLIDKLEERSELPKFSIGLNELVPGADNLKKFLDGKFIKHVRNLAKKMKKYRKYIGVPKYLGGGIINKVIKEILKQSGLSKQIESMFKPLIPELNTSAIDPITIKIQKFIDEFEKEFQNPIEEIKVELENAIKNASIMLGTFTSPDLKEQFKLISRKLGIDMDFDFKVDDGFEKLKEIIQKILEIIQKLINNIDCAAYEIINITINTLDHNTPEIDLKSHKIKASNRELTDRDIVYLELALFVLNNILGNYFKNNEDLYSITNIASNSIANYLDEK